MPTELNDVDTSGTELWFSDDLEAETFLLRENAVYDAAEVREETGTDVPEFGRWFPVEHAQGEGWAVALGELVEELQDADADLTAVEWTVTRAEKSGPEQTDAYEVNVDVHDGKDAEQTSL